MTKPYSFSIFIANCFISGTHIKMALMAPVSSWIGSIHTSCSHILHTINEDERLATTNVERLPTSFPQLWWKSLLIHNSKVKSPDLEGCEHDGPYVTTSHEGNNTMDELGDLFWLMISKKLKDHTSQRNSNHKFAWLKYEVCWKEKNQILRAAKTKECLKTKDLNFKGDLA